MFVEKWRTKYSTEEVSLPTREEAPFSPVDNNGWWNGVNHCGNSTMQNKKPLMEEAEEGEEGEEEER